jgi:hypothetical protein
MRRDGASRILSVKSRVALPLRCWEEAVAKRKGEDGEMADKDDTLVHRERDGLRRNYDVAKSELKK